MLGLTSMSGDRHQYQIDINSLPYYKTELHPSVKKICTYVITVSLSKSEAIMLRSNNRLMLSRNLQ